MDVLGIGAINVDLIYEVTWPIPFFRFERGSENVGREEEREEIKERLNREGKFKAKAHGGQAANTIYALGKMGFSVGFTGCIGEDKDGDFLLQGFLPVNTTKIKRKGRSGLCLILLDKMGERTSILFPNPQEAAFDIDVKWANEASILYLSSFVSDEAFDLQRQLVRELDPSKTKIMLDPGELYANRGIEQLLPLLERLYTLFVTEKELLLLTKCTDYKRGSRHLLGLGAKIVVCKRGSEGSYVLTDNEEFELKANKTEVVDTTGAGDVYAAGFIAGLLLKKPLEECVKIASLSASRAIRGYGREQYPDRGFLERII